jgi:hypothetical protein
MYIYRGFGYLEPRASNNYRKPWSAPSPTTCAHMAPHPISHVQIMWRLILGICFYGNYGCDARFEHKNPHV